jgi:hypothetical protein
MKRFIILALALMAFVTPIAASYGVASADYHDDQYDEQAP